MANPGIMKLVLHPDESGHLFGDTNAFKHYRFYEDIAGMLKRKGL